MPGNTYDQSMCMAPTMQASRSECFRVNLKMSDSWPTSPVAPVATEMDWGEIILPQTPPQVLAEMVITGSMPILSAVTAWSLPNRAFVEVSEPVMNTPSQPRMAAKNGKTEAVEAKAVPSVIAMPEKFMM